MVTECIIVTRLVIRIDNVWYFNSNYNKKCNIRSSCDWKKCGIDIESNWIRKDMKSEVEWNSRDSCCGREANVFPTRNVGLTAVERIGDVIEDELKMW